MNHSDTKSSSDLSSPLRGTGGLPTGGQGAVIDVGKTNKKLFVFDEQYQIVHEQTDQFPEIKDEDGFPTENLELLTNWVKEAYQNVLSSNEFNVRAINFSAYGASFVHLDKEGRPVTPLYNYLKPYPEELQKQFYDTYGGEEKMSLETASPVLGHLNSGMQLYWLKHHRPEVYRQIACSLHLPQYLSYLITGSRYADLTSIGCHTGLWDYQKGNYHNWVYVERLTEKFPPLFKGSDVISVNKDGKQLPAGVGLHDSSAALIPYLASFHEPFVLISTGTWCISLNPFNSSPLSAEELQQDCLSYLTYEGKPVKAARLFAGNDHEAQVKRIAAHYHVADGFYKAVDYNPALKRLLQSGDKSSMTIKQPFKGGTQPSAFGRRHLNDYASPEEAYHQLMLDIIEQQIASTQLVLKNTFAKKLFVDGGFSKNSIYMNLLATAFPQMEVCAASVAQATAAGAALTIHDCWNKCSLKKDIIHLRCFAPAPSIVSD